jgi:hypothetical protein
VRSPFILLGPAHLAALALSLLAPLLLAALVRFGRWPVDRLIRQGLAALLAVSWITGLLLFASRGWLSWSNALPLNLCD